MRRFLIGMCVAAGLAAAAGPEFEVASVKPAAPSNLAPGMVGGPGTDRPGELAGA